MLLPFVGVQESLAEDTVDSSRGRRGNFGLASQHGGAEVSSEVPPCTKASFGWYSSICSTLCPSSGPDIPSLEFSTRIPWGLSVDATPPPSTLERGNYLVEEIKLPIKGLPTEGHMTASFVHLYSLTY